MRKWLENTYMGLGGFLFGNTGWQQGNIATEIAKNDAAGQNGLASWQQFNLPVGGTGSSGLYNNNAMVWGGPGGQGYLPWLQDQSQAQNGRINAQFDPNRQFMTSPMAAAMGNQYNYGAGLEHNTGVAGQVFGSGGWSPQYQQGYDQLGNYMNGGMPGQGDAQSLAAQFLSNKGQTAYTQNSQARAGEAANTGGWNPFLSGTQSPLYDGIINTQGNTNEQGMLTGLGGTVTGANLGTNGLTQTGAQGERTALGILQAGGANGTTQGMQQFGTQMATQNPLMSPAQAMSFAADQAGTKFKQGAESAYGKALARGGGAGANVANGASNRALADYSDAGSQGVASSVQQALLNQQQLQLQEQQQGTQMALGGGNLQNSFLGTGGGILNGLENTANGRLGIGGGMLNDSLTGNTSRLLGGYNAIGNLSNAATNRLQAYNQLGLGAGQNEIGYANAGLSAADILQRGSLGTMNSYNNMMGNQNQYQLGAGALQNQMGKTSADIMSQIYNNEIGSGQLGLNQAVGTNNAYNQGMQNNLGLGGLYNANYSAYANPMVALAGQGSDIYRQYMSNMPGFAGAGSNMVSNGVIGQAAVALAGASSRRYKRQIQEL